MEDEAALGALAGRFERQDFGEQVLTESGSIWDFTAKAEPSCVLAHPWAIAAFGRECGKRGIYPHTSPAPVNLTTLQIQPTRP